jgi:hypothetical protein
LVAGAARQLTFDTFLVTIPRREGRVRLRWAAPDGSVLLSREAVAAARDV